jgi:hypothetical protein
MNAHTTPRPTDRSRRIRCALSTHWRVQPASCRLQLSARPRPASTFDPIPAQKPHRALMEHNRLKAPPPPPPPPPLPPSIPRHLDVGPHGAAHRVGAVGARQPHLHHARRRPRQRHSRERWCARKVGRGRGRGRSCGCGRHPHRRGRERNRPAHRGQTPRDASSCCRRKGGQGPTRDRHAARSMRGCGEQGDTGCGASCQHCEQGCR